MWFETLDDVKSYAKMPSRDIEGLDCKEPGWILKTAAAIESEITNQLSKRYGSWRRPYPVILLRWAGALLDPEMYDKRGVNPSDEQQRRIDERASVARQQISQAADPKGDGPNGGGQWEIALRQDTTTSGIVEPATLAYSEASPYTGKHRQFDRVSNNRRYG
jgi:hypothetical protein